MAQIAAVVGLFLVLVLVAAITWRPVGARIRKKLEAVAIRINLIETRVAYFPSADNYTRESQRVRLVAEAQAALRPTKTIGWLCFSNAASRVSAKKLAQFVAISESLVTGANEKFVEAQLREFSEFFDSVESKPLTLAQRQACIVNQDNNLVLAGAGTGKTSTMIGRAGYLMASGRARPGDLLMIAYGKKAADEMQERLDKRLRRWLKDGSPTIKTFHALGLEIIANVEGRRPDLTPMVEDQMRFGRFIDAQIDKFSSDPVYRKKVIRYCGSEKYPYRNPFDFNSMKDYEDYVQSTELRTLKGEMVKSFEECVIANFLNANSVRYEYERPYQINTAGPDYRQYKPDFYLPDYGVYIEHFALDSRGMPPAWFNQQKYLDGIKWKRELHREHKTKLIETYSYLKRQGLLETRLTESLQAAGVELVPRPDEELLDELRKSTEVSSFAELLSGFLKLAKETGHSLDDLRDRASSHIDSSRLTLLLDLLAPVLESYQAELQKKEQIDFGDMIRRAKTYVENGSFRSRYAHILVDEFQDISKARAELVSALIKQNPETVLFVVGDDWQSIYRFTGSDIAYTRDFAAIFGPTAVTPLDLTFRFNNQIGEVASKFVLKNPAQIPKAIRSNVILQKPTVSLIRAVRSGDGLHMAFEAIVRRTAKDSNIHTVLVLGRYNLTVDDWRTKDGQRSLKSSYPSLQIDPMTVHSAKGKEADYVIVLGLGRGEFGFPSEKSTDALLDFLLPERELFPLAEERRLFYVALTRARRRVYLVYNPVDASRFVLELKDMKNGYPVCTDEIDPQKMAPEIAYVPCPACGAGSLVRRNGPHGPFVGCNNSHCRHTENACPQCRSVMKRVKAVFACTNPKCNTSVPICSNCGAMMVERDGKWGKFWGCSNYRQNAGFVCTNTMNIRPTRLRK